MGLTVTFDMLRTLHHNYIGACNYKYKRLSHALTIDSVTVVVVVIVVVAFTKYA